MYMYMCMCVCVCIGGSDGHMHTQPSIIYYSQYSLYQNDNCCAL